LYGSQEHGTNKFRTYVEIIPNPPEYHATIRQTRCDAQGAFVFDAVKPGDFYVQTTVSWNAGGYPQGGNVMQLVHITAAGAPPVVLAP
jgi:hypothetical protein